MQEMVVIVESPAKANTIKKILGKNYKVIACNGHIRDLPKSRMGIDIEKGFKPEYIVIKGKTQIIKNIKSETKNAKCVYLAPDPDREGEAIAWHLKEILSSMGDKIKRIEFNEITAPAVRSAIENPRDIDINKVSAQQARRILDRLVGYNISPLLWKKVKKGLSAGRVQSVAVRIICDREKEIKNFKQEEYWSIEALAFHESEPDKIFTAKFYGLYEGQEKIELKNQQESEKIVEELEKSKFVIDKIKRSERKRKAYPPFITSTLQQEASRKYGWGARKTMVIAQQLYEGVSIGDDRLGLITYMRTDSVRISDEAILEVRKLIKDQYGKQYLPETPKLYKSKKQSQDAHEAIRPTYVEREPDQIKTYLSEDQYKLYCLVWLRFVACQMEDVIFDVTSVDIKCDKYLLRATGSIIKFDGFMCIYMEDRDENNKDENDDKEELLPNLSEGEMLVLNEIKPNQHFTQPPPKYTEATLVKALEEDGIGRPSTYAPIISTIQDRRYVDKIENRLHPTKLGIVVNDLLTKHFASIVDIGFTAEMEDKLDLIIEEKADWLQMLTNFYGPFMETMKKAEKKIEKIELPQKVTNEKCSTCGKNLVVRSGRFGDFLACSGFPKCRFTKAIDKDLGIECPKCGGKIVERKTKRRKIFYGCSNYPKCNFAAWDKPIKTKCKKCGYYMLEKINAKKKEKVEYCPNCKENEKKEHAKEAKKNITG